MNELTHDELMNLHGGQAFFLPPTPVIDGAFWMQRAIWAYLQDA